MNDVIKIPVPDKHIRLVWKGVNEAMVFSDCLTPEKSSASNLLTSVKWLSSMQDPILRYLAIQSYHIFESTQNLSAMDLDNILTKSKEYRAVLSECEEQITIEIKNLENSETCDEEKLEFITSQCNIVRDYQMLWHLAEIFFIKLSSPGYFIHDLLNWLNLQQPQVSVDYNLLIDEYNSSNGDTEVELNEKYWPTVYCLACHGRMAELLNLLACHTHTNGQAFRAVRDVISTMPIFSSEYIKHTAEFDYAWMQWHKIAVSKLTDSYLLTAYPSLEILANIILGNRDILFNEQLTDVLEGCWFYSVVAHLNYSQPLADVATVSRMHKEYKRTFQNSIVLSGDTTGELCSEQILLAIDACFNCDLAQFVSHIANNSNTWWLCAHLIDLIEKINPHLFTRPMVPINRSIIFNEDVIDTEFCNVRESFILHYASAFVSHPALTIMALNYMDYCPIMGASYINQIIDHLHMQTDKIATMIHSWCIKKKHEVIATSICKRWSVSYYKSGQLGNSLTWAIKGNDVNFISRIADKLLRDFFANIGDISMARNCHNLVNCLKDINVTLMGKKMTFAIQFFQIHALITDGQLKLAAPLLINLIQSQLVSSHFNIDILLAVKPLLTQSTLLQMNDVYKLLELLEEASDIGNRISDVRELQQILVDKLASSCLVTA